MNHFIRALFVFVTLIFILSGCGVKEGAEFYALQKQNERLTETVSNLQIQVSELIVENNDLRRVLATNSLAVSFLIQDERKQELSLEKLQKQASKNSDAGQTVEQK
ncbi:MAG TPA: hypothetical protein VH280_16785 [Verrucomicrobiae bacterium]|jgi:ABC-type uncharacterized transport system auxiliary subunit|nr:hypothetical protein [Verrucomicrobiae bacterium]